MKKKKEIMKVFNKMSIKISVHIVSPSIFA